MKRLLATLLAAAAASRQCPYFQAFFESRVGRHKESDESFTC